ncbi:MAG: type IV pili methyl-accepting chemotaxis transducer N-terminal domain-containing protein, partial [Pseudomonadota bacterium]
AAEEAQIINAGIVENVGAQERINLSGKLRMLSQRIPAAACHFALGIDTAASKDMLAGATEEFDQILTALEVGDPELGIIGEETRRKTLIRVFSLREAWEPFKAAALSVANGENTDANLEALIAGNIDVLDRAKVLVSELVGQYSNPADMVQADSMVIDIAGRQRMLTQKMSKESCIMMTDYATPETADALAGTMQMFETSLEALRFGLPAAGIKGPPTSGISSGLGLVDDNWKSVKPMLEAVASGAELDSTASAAKFQQLNTTMANMNAVVGLYAAYAKPDA